MDTVASFSLEIKDDWESRWVVSDWKKSEGKAGNFKHSAGRWAADVDDKGIIPVGILGSTFDFNVPVKL